jgi:hypothetical protein
MELTNKAFAVKGFAHAKQVHDDAVTKGAKCGPGCDMFHKAATPTASKAYTLDRARALLFLRDI